MRQRSSSGLNAPHPASLTGEELISAEHANSGASFVFDGCTYGVTFMSSTTTRAVFTSVPSGTLIAPGSVAGPKDVRGTDAVPGLVPKFDLPSKEACISTAFPPAASPSKRAQFDAKSLFQQKGSPTAVPVEALESQGGAEPRHSPISPTGSQDTDLDRLVGELLDGLSAAQLHSVTDQLAAYVNGSASEKDGRTLARVA